MSENKMIKDLTVEELKDIIRDTIREELSIIQINQACPPYPIPAIYKQKFENWLNNPIC